MTNFLLYVVFSIFILSFKTTGAYPPSGLDYRGSRRQRDVPCRADLEYSNGNICCLNCPAGTHVKSVCNKNGEKGKCEECDYRTFTEHANGLPQCFKCTQCRSDQEIVRHCTGIQDTECRCKPGGFCSPDQACEVCKRCLKCEKDEVVVRNCTSTTNTECKKIQPSAFGSAAVSAAVIVPLLLITAAVIVMIICWRKRCKSTDDQRNLPDGVKAGQCYTEERRETQRSSCSSWPLVRAKSSAGMEDECKVLCESLNSSASNSQHSLTGLPSSAFPAPLPQPVQPIRREEEQFPKLNSVNGEESLKKCFEYFEAIDINYHKRFFRHLGIADNVIKSKEHLLYEDKIHELLNIWVEKEGRDASFNDLLKALLDLDQRRTAETIMENAIHNGHYVCECNES